MLVRRIIMEELIEEYAGLGVGIITTLSMIGIFSNILSEVMFY